MTIFLNGNARDMAADTCIQDLISHLPLSQARFAVEVNGTLVPRSTYAVHKLQPDDQVEIVHAIGGG